MKLFESLKTRAAMATKQQRIRDKTKTKLKPNPDEIDNQFYVKQMHALGLFTDVLIWMFGSSVIAHTDWRPLK